MVVPYAIGALVLLLLGIGYAQNAQPGAYFGRSLGSFKSADGGTSGDVFAADPTTLMVANFKSHGKKCKTLMAAPSNYGQFSRDKIDPSGLGINLPVKYRRAGQSPRRVKRADNFVPLLPSVNNYFHPLDSFPFEFAHLEAPKATAGTIGNAQSPLSVGVDEGLTLNLNRPAASTTAQKAATSGASSSTWAAGQSTTISKTAQPTSPLTLSSAPTTPTKTSTSARTTSSAAAQTSKAAEPTPSETTHRAAVYAFAQDTTAEELTTGSRRTTADALASRRVRVDFAQTRRDPVPTAESTPHGAVIVLGGGFNRTFGPLPRWPATEPTVIDAENETETETATTTTAKPVKKRKFNGHQFVSIPPPEAPLENESRWKTTTPPPASPKPKRFDFVGLIKGGKSPGAIAVPAAGGDHLGDDTHTTLSAQQNILRRRNEIEAIEAAKRANRKNNNNATEAPIGDTGDVEEEAQTTKKPILVVARRGDEVTPAAPHANPEHTTLSAEQVVARRRAEIKAAQERNLPTTTTEEPEPGPTREPVLVRDSQRQVQIVDNSISSLGLIVQRKRPDRGRKSGPSPVIQQRQKRSKAEAFHVDPVMEDVENIPRTTAGPTPPTKRTKHHRAGVTVRLGAPTAKTSTAAPKSRVGSRVGPPSAGSPSARQSAQGEAASPGSHSPQGSNSWVDEDGVLRFVFGGVAEEHPTLPPIRQDVTYPAEYFERRRNITWTTESEPETTTKPSINFSAPHIRPASTGRTTTQAAQTQAETTAAWTTTAEPVTTTEEPRTHATDEFVPTTQTPTPAPDVDVPEFVNPDGQLLIHMPEGQTINNFQWVGIYDHCRQELVAQVIVPPNFVAPVEAVVPGMKGWSFGTNSGNIRIMNCNSVLVTNFTFLGDAPDDAHFYVGYGEFPQGAFQKAPASIVGEEPGKPLRTYRNEDVFIRLPPGWRTFDIDWLIVYSPQRNQAYGHAPLAKYAVPPCDVQ